MHVTGLVLKSRNRVTRTAKALKLPLQSRALEIIPTTCQGRLPLHVSSI